MNYQVVFHNEAEIEYSEAFVWYELRANGLGIKFYEAVQEAINRIKSNPEAFAKRKAGFREAPVSDFPFKVVYSILPKEEVLLISAIFHTSRNPKKKYRK